MKLTEKPPAESNKAPRVAELSPGQSTTRNQSPVLLDSGATFQITANSKVNGEPREVKIQVQTAAVCSGAIHPLAKWIDSEGEASAVTKKHTLSYYRNPMPGDETDCGFFAMLNAAFAYGSTTQYPVAINSCGSPQQGDVATRNISAVIEVFPGDQFAAELSVPAFLKPDSLEYSKATESWTSQRDKDKEEIAEAGEKADAYYKSEKEFFKEIGSSKAEFREFAEDQEKRRIGYVAGNPDGLKVKLSQTDGNRTLSATVDDVIKLVRLVRQAEYRFKEFNEWIDSLQVGPGVSFKVECQFLILKLIAKWGYVEYLDDRVFMGYSGSIDIDIIKAGLTASLGFKSAGLCDLLLFLQGEGALGVTVPEITRETPDDPPKAKVKPRGELKFAGGVEGTLMWVAKVQGKVEVVFKAETEQVHFLSEEGILSGEIVVSREPLEASVEASCRLYGTRTKKVTLVKADPRLAHFDF